MPAIQRYTKEASALTKLALPLLAAQSLTTGTGVVDAMMSGHYSAEALAAVAIGNSLWLPVYLLIAGLLIGSTAMVSRFHGSGSKADIVSTVQQSIWLALSLALVSVWLLRNSGVLLGWLKLSEEVRPIAEGYLSAFSWGVPAIAIFNGLRAFTEGMGRTRPYMISSLIAFLANIPMNYMLIYGRWGAPELGAVGCGWATALSLWLQVILLFIFTRSPSRYEGISLYQNLQKPNLRWIRRVGKLGWPIALGAFAEVTIFSMIALLIARLDASVVAGHQVALSSSHLIFMLPLSLSQAVTIRVGNQLGAGDQRGANLTVRTGLLCALLLALTTFTLIISLRGLIIGLYTNDTAVIAVAFSLFFWMACYQLPDHLQIVANASLRAYHDTRIPMALILTSYWGVCLPLGYLLGITDHITASPMQAEGFWVALFVGLILSSFLLLSRLRRVVKRPPITA